MWTYIIIALITYVICFFGWLAYEMHTAPIMSDEYDRPILKDDNNA